MAAPGYVLSRTEHGRQAAAGGTTLGDLFIFSDSLNINRPLALLARRHVLVEEGVRELSRSYRLGLTLPTISHSSLSSTFPHCTGKNRDRGTSSTINSSPLHLSTLMIQVPTASRVLGDIQAVTEYYY